MDINIKAKWVAALLSGEYTQGRRRLRTDNNFCCLGVLCDLHAKETNSEHEWKHNHYMGSKDDLPNEVVFWSGLMDKNPRVQTPKDYSSPYGQTYLECLNDSGCSFEMIADLIDKHL